MSDSGEPRAIAFPVSAGGKDGTWRARKGEREVSGISQLPIPLILEGAEGEWTAW